MLAYPLVIAEREERRAVAAVVTAPSLDTVCASWAYVEKSRAGAAGVCGCRQHGSVSMRVASIFAGSAGFCWQWRAVIYSCFHWLLLLVISCCLVSTQPELDWGAGEQCLCLLLTQLVVENHLLFESAGENKVDVVDSSAGSLIFTRRCSRPL